MTPAAGLNPPTRPSQVAALPQPVSSRLPLTRAGCLALLAPGGHGRVAATMRAVPIIIPVTFTLLAEHIVFSPGPDEGLSHAITNAVVAFETDHIGPGGQARWHVHLTGVARALTPGTDAPGFRLSSELITGWRADC